MGRHEASRAIILRGTFIQAISLLALPSLASQILQTVAWLGEMYFVKRLGDAAIAAIGAVDEATWIPFTIVMAMLTATVTLIAQNWGAGNYEATRDGAISAIQQCLLLSLIVASVWLFRDIIWSVFNLTTEVEMLATRYLFIFITFVVPVVLSLLLGAIYHGLGDVVTPFIATALGVATQLALNAFLVPRLGIDGAAIAAVSSYCIRLLFLMALLWRSPVKPNPHYILRLHFNMHMQLLKLSLPVCLQSIQWALCSFAFFSIIGRTSNSTDALAALTLGWRIESLMLMPAFALASAAQTMVGQNVGAGQIERAKSHSYRVTLLGMALLAALGGIFFVTADMWAQMFAHGKLTMRYVSAYLRVNAIAEPFVAMGAILGGSLRGAGDMLSPAIITIFSIWVVRIPITYWLCILERHDAIAAWWAMAISNVVGGLLTLLPATLVWKRLKRPCEVKNVA
ncbi:MAG: MATE family efflux transporter [Armatimonadota bacterium]|nr:MATE family efflux transporter [Armatimonadota bacterium]MCX7777320.1 MATE family efflux transporter [Armatimonadota bacterium]MDW8024363.1 MATE family efflux transporter [Armatimonadota bacterium]